MNASFRTAFWAMCLGLTVPMILFVGVELTSGGRSARKLVGTAPSAAGPAKAQLAQLPLVPGNAPPLYAEKETHRAARPTGRRDASGRTAPGATGRIDTGDLLEDRSPAAHRDVSTIPEIDEPPAPIHISLGPQLELDPQAPEAQPESRGVVARRTVNAPQLEVVDEATLRPAAATDPNLARQLDRILAQLGRLQQAVEEQPVASPRPEPQPLFSKIYRPRYLSVKALRALAAPLLTDGLGRIGVADDEATTGAADDDPPARSEAVVVRDTLDVLRKIDRLLVELDQAPLTILIEATVLAVRLDEGNAQGVDLAELAQGRANGQATPFVFDATSAPRTGGKGESEGSAARKPPRLVHGAGVKSGVLRGDVQAYLRNVKQKLAIDDTLSWQTTVANRQTADFLLPGPTAHAADGRRAPLAGPRIKVRASATRNGSVQLDVRPRTGPLPGEPLAAIAPTINAYSNQFVVRDGETAVFGGFIHEIPTGDRRPANGDLPDPAATATAHAPVERIELVILLTPHVLAPASVAQAPATRGRGKSPTTKISSAPGPLPRSSEPKKSLPPRPLEASPATPPSTDRLPSTESPPPAAKPDAAKPDASGAATSQRPRIIPAASTGTRTVPRPVVTKKSLVSDAPATDEIPELVLPEFSTIR